MVGHAPATISLFNAASISRRTLPNGVRGLVKATRGTALVTVQDQVTPVSWEGIVSVKLMLRPREERI